MSSSSQDSDFYEHHSGSVSDHDSPMDASSSSVGSSSSEPHFPRDDVKFRTEHFLRSLKDIVSIPRREEADLVSDICDAIEEALPDGE